MAWYTNILNDKMNKWTIRIFLIILGIILLWLVFSTVLGIGNGQHVKAGTVEWNSNDTTSKASTLTADNRSNITSGGTSYSTHGDESPIINGGSYKPNSTTNNYKEEKKDASLVYGAYGIKTENKGDTTILYIPIRNIGETEAENVSCSGKLLYELTPNKLFGNPGLTGNIVSALIPPSEEIFMISIYHNKMDFENIKYRCYIRVNGTYKSKGLLKNFTIWYAYNRDISKWTNSSDEKQLDESYKSFVQLE